GGYQVQNAAILTVAPPSPCWSGRRDRRVVAVGQLHERIRVVDQEPELGLGEHSDEVVLEQGGQGPVDGDRSLGGQPVADATDRPPRGLGPVATVPDDVGQVGGGDTLTEEAGAAEQPTAGEQCGGVAVGGQVSPDGPAVGVHGAPQDRLEDRVEIGRAHV